ncbi:MAG: DNA polymerase [Cyanobacteria bacterium J06621_8]
MMNQDQQKFSFYSHEQSQALLQKLRHRTAYQSGFGYELVSDSNRLDFWVSKIKAESRFITVDTETKSLTPAPGVVRTIQIAYSKSVPVLIVDLPKIKDRTSLIRLMADSKLLKVGQNFKFDMLMLEAEGIRVKGPVLCTMLGYRVLKAGATRSASLKFIAQDLANVELNKAEQNSSWQGLLSRSQLQYAADDAAVLIEVFTKLQQKLAQAGLTQIAILEYCCLLPIAQMQHWGIYLDQARWQAVGQDYAEQRHKLEGEIYHELGQEFNIASSKQLKTALLDCNIEVETTSSSVLIEHTALYPVLAQIIRYRSLNTIINTFFTGLVKYLHQDGRLRGDWQQIGTRTGRTSCHRPNLANIPKVPQIRSCFRAVQGYSLIDADYSQIELRLAAVRMRVPTLIQAFIAKQDVHALTASYVYDCTPSELEPEQRRLGKILNLGLIYGMGAEKFRLDAAKKFNVYLTKARAKELRQMFFNLYPEINHYHQLCRRDWQRGCQRETSTLGRANVWSSKPKLNQIINYPIQADCADILKQALSNWYLEYLEQKLDARLVLAVYDQLVVEARQEQVQHVTQVLRRCMTIAAQKILHPVPVVVDIKVGTYWS